MRGIMLLLSLTLAFMLLSACGGEDGNGDSAAISSVSFESEGFSGPEVALAPADAPAAFFEEAAPDFADESVAREADLAGAPSAPGAAGAAEALAIGDRKVINTGSVAVRVEVVADAVTQVRTVAETLGGFVGQLSLFGEAEAQQATITIRVPQDQFFTALDRLEALGKVLSKDIGSQDVSEQFIDLEARLKSLQQEEARLLDLLGVAESVSDILAIESELARVRAGIESIQGTLNFLQRRVDLSTITVSLFGPETPFVQPPSASLEVAVGNVTGTVDRLKALVAANQGLVDSIFISTSEDEESAFVEIRVPTANFEQALAAIEARGDVRAKEVQQSGQPPDPTIDGEPEPDARIGVSLIEKDGSDAGLIAAIAAPIGGVVLAAGLGGALYLRRRSRVRTPQPE